MKMKMSSRPIKTTIFLTVKAVELQSLHSRQQHLQTIAYSITLPDLEPCDSDCSILTMKSPCLLPTSICYFPSWTTYIENDRVQHPRPLRVPLLKHIGVVSVDMQGLYRCLRDGRPQRPNNARSAPRQSFRAKWPSLWNAMISSTSAPSSAPYRGAPSTLTI